MSASLAATAACENRRFCYATPAVTAQVIRLTAGNVMQYRELQIAVRFHNPTSVPLVLAENVGSPLAIDEMGNRYPSRGTEVQGMGQQRTGTIDASFVLQPGESRDAVFTLAFNPGSATVGTSISFVAAIVEVESVAGNQPRAGRQHALAFYDMGLSGPNAPRRTQ